MSTARAPELAMFYMAMENGIFEVRASMLPCPLPQLSGSHCTVLLVHNICEEDLESTVFEFGFGECVFPLTCILRCHALLFCDCHSVWPSRPLPPSTAWRPRSTYSKPARNTMGVTPAAAAAIATHLTVCGALQSWSAQDQQRKVEPSVPCHSLHQWRHTKASWGMCQFDV